MTHRPNELAITARVYMVTVCARCGRLILCGDRCWTCCGPREVRRQRKRHKVRSAA